MYVCMYILNINLCINLLLYILHFALVCKSNLLAKLYRAL